MKISVFNMLCKHLKHFLFHMCCKVEWCVQNVFVKRIGRQTGACLLTESVCHRVYSRSFSFMDVHNANRWAIFFKYARHKIVYGLISRAPVESSSMKYTFCKLDITFRRIEDIEFLVQLYMLFMIVMQETYQNYMSNGQKRNWCLKGLSFTDWASDVP